MNQSEKDHEKSYLIREFFVTSQLYLIIYLNINKNYAQKYKYFHIIRLIVNKCNINNIVIKLYIVLFGT